MIWGWKGPNATVQGSSQGATGCGGKGTQKNEAQPQVTPLRVFLAQKAPPAELTHPCNRPPSASHKCPSGQGESVLRGHCDPHPQQSGWTTMMPPRTWCCCRDRSEERRGLLTCEVCGGNWLCQVVFGGHLFPPTWFTAGLCGYRRLECPFQFLPRPPQQAQCRLTASGCLGRLEQALSAGPDQELTFPGFPQP